MINRAWNNRLRAYPVVNQKNTLNIPEISKIAHTSIENVPKDFDF